MPFASPLFNKLVRFQLIILLLIFQQELAARQKFDTYYVSIGSVYYKNNPQFKRPWENLEEAETSARIMANVFSKCANAKGVTVISKKDQLFSRAMLQQSLNQVWQMMLRDKPTNPLVVIYFCGHGFSENLVNSQFLISGDCSTMQEKETFDNFSKKNVFVPEIVEMIRKLCVEHANELFVPRYMLLLDCCRNRKQNDSLDLKKVKQQWGQQSGEVQLIFSQANRLAVNMYRRSEKLADPIVYATKETSGASVTSIPSIKFEMEKPVMATGIGPICRRALLLLNQLAAGEESSIDLEQFVSRLQDKNLDPDFKTNIPVSPYTTGRQDNGSFLTVQPADPAQRPQAFNAEELTGKWLGRHYYGDPAKKPERSYGGVGSLPPLIDTSYIQLTIDRIAGSTCYGSLYEYFFPDSAHNHNIIVFEGTIDDGKLSINAFRPVGQLLQKYPDRYWCNGTGHMGVFRKTAAQFTLSGTTGKDGCQGGPYRLYKERPRAAPQVNNGTGDKRKPAGSTDQLVTDDYKKRKVKIIETLAIESKQVQLQFYDNGEIDGDSISIFINGNLYLAHRKLTAVPITFTLNLDEYGERVLVSMFAENLGEIPPNTAVMEIIDGAKKRAIRLSSTLDTSSTVELKKR